MRYADTEAVRRFLEERDVDSASAATCSKFARSDIRLIPWATLGEDNSPPGTSKIGGLPDLPAGATWPTRRYEYPEEEKDLWSEEDRIQPLSLLAQINLGEVAKAGCDLPLPPAGLLLFFYDVEGQPSGSKPVDATGSQVLFVSPGTPTRRQANPQGTSSRVRPLELRPSQGLPRWPWVEQEAKRNLDAFDDAFDALIEPERNEIAFDGHMLGGWPHVIQNPMERECASITRRIYGTDSDDGKLPPLKKRAKDWRLLLQVNTDHDLGWMWGDMGKLYFWCREDDIRQGRFDRVWTILQF